MSLSLKRERFAQHYAITNNGAQAAKLAGYAPGCARVTASRLLTDDNVVAAVRTFRNEVEASMAMTREHVIEGLLEAVSLARDQADPSAMVSAFREIAKICGYYAPERTVKVDVNIAAKRFIDRLETLSDGELLRLVESKEEPSLASHSDP